MREASHIIRYVILDWTQPALLNLIMRRLLNNSALLEEFGIDRAAILESADQQEALFYRFFPFTSRTGTPEGVYVQVVGNTVR